MATHRLDRLFAPRSVALVGASAREGSFGRAMLANIRAGGFSGRLHLVNSGHVSVDGVPCLPSLTAIGEGPDLVIVAVPGPAVRAVVAEAVEVGAGVCLIVSRLPADEAPELRRALVKKAGRAGMRLLGPASLGVAAPRARLNASLAHEAPAAGELALVSQSGTVAAAILAWAGRRGIGFSGAVSLGDMADIDLDDCLDHFAQDGGTRAILIAMEHPGEPRAFMSAARAAARVKPVVVLKIGSDGRERAGKAPGTHAAVLAREGLVYGAAFRRAGLVEVADLDELFAAAGTLGCLKPFGGERLAIMANGSGIGALAAGRLSAMGGCLADPAPATCERLAAVREQRSRHGGVQVGAMPATMPFDFDGAGDAAGYEAAATTLLSDPSVDALMAFHAPSAVSGGLAEAGGLGRAAAAHRRGHGAPKPVLAVWLGEDEPIAAALDKAAIPRFPTETAAVSGFLHMVNYRRGLDALMQAPPPAREGAEPDIAGARALLAGQDESVRWLGPVDTTRLLALYGIPVAPASTAATPQDAVAVAASWLTQGRAVAVKANSPDIAHKSDVGGVLLNLATDTAVEQATRAILEGVPARAPGARLRGVTVHPMSGGSDVREVFAGLANDPVFGPVILFGRGGTAVEVIDDKALALPPLDSGLARALIARTRVARVLERYRGAPAADLDAVADLLVRLSAMAVDLPGIEALDLNPVLAGPGGVVVVDARVRVRAPARADTDLVDGRLLANPRLAVRPYPREWERRFVLDDGTRVLARPVRPEDEALYPGFFTAVTPEDMRLRFFGLVQQASHAFIARLTQLDYSRAMAWIALAEESGEMLGVVRLHADANRESGEYAVLVRSDLKGRGLGWRLMRIMIEFARAEGLRRVEGQVLRENRTMLSMCERLGFHIEPDPDDSGVRLVTLRVEDGAVSSAGVP